MFRFALLGIEAAAAQVRALAAAPSAELATVFDPDAETAARIAQTFGATVATELSTALDGVDGALVCGAPSLRTEMAGTAIASGCDVLVASPTATGEEARRRLLSALVRAPRRVVTMVSHDTLHSPAIEALTDVLGEDDPIAIEIQHHDPDEDGDLIATTMTSDLQLVGALTGREVAATQAVGHRTRLGAPLRHAHALLVLDDDTSVSLVASRCGATRVHTVTVVTAKARITCDLHTGIVEATQSAGADARGHVRSLSQRTTAPPRDPLTAQLEAFIQCARHRTNARMSLGVETAAAEAATAITRRIDLIDHRPASKTSR